MWRKKIELVSINEKIKIAQNLLNDPSALTYFKKTTKKLKIEMKKGNKVAKSEYDEWTAVVSNEKGINIPKYNQILDNM